MSIASSTSSSDEGFHPEFYEAYEFENDDNCTEDALRVRVDGAEVSYPGSLAVAFSDDHIVDLLRDEFKSLAIPEQVDCWLKQLALPPRLCALIYNSFVLGVEEAEKSAKMSLECMTENFVTLERSPVLHSAFLLYSKSKEFVPNEKLINLVPRVYSAMIDLKCAFAVLKGSHVFVPGVLGVSKSFVEGAYTSIYLPCQTVRKGIKRLPSKVVHIAEGRACFGRNKLIGANAVKKGIAIKVTKRIFERFPSNDAPSNFFIVDDYSSALCACVLYPKPNDRVISLFGLSPATAVYCGMLMQNTGSFVVCDKRTRRLAKLKQQIRDFGLNDIFVTVHQDACRIQFNDDSLFKLCSYDAVLVEPACSGLGRRPLLLKKLSLERLNALLKLQRKSLINGIELLKPGGILVYCTYSVTLAENERQVSWILEKYPNMNLITQEPFHIGGSGYPVVESHALLQRLGPFSSSKLDVLGCFVAKFRKLG